MIVKPGQVWKDNDKRTPRTLDILRQLNDLYVEVRCRESGKVTRITIRRFNPKSSTGYTLIQDVSNNKISS